MTDKIKTPMDPTKLMDHTVKHPGFTGEYEFELVFILLGERVERKARIEWELTPEWPYYDMHLKRIYKGIPGSSLSLKLLSKPETDFHKRSRRSKPKWVWCESSA